jgi:hypothetical protein
LNRIKIQLLEEIYRRFRFTKGFRSLDVEVTSGLRKSKLVQTPLSITHDRLYINVTKLLLLTAIELSLAGSSSYTSTDKTNKKNIHKRNNTRNTVQTVQNTLNKSTHITKTPTHYKTHTYTHPIITIPTHTRNHTLQNKLKKPLYKVHTK